MNLDRYELIAFKGTIVFHERFPLSVYLMTMIYNNYLIY